jgi:hypothetical protein
MTMRFACCPILSSRPIRCSTTMGFQGKS